MTLTHVVYREAAIRVSAGKALSKALAVYPDLIDDSLGTLYDLYTLKAQLPTPEYDDYGMVIPESLNKEDEYRERSGVALCLTALVPVITGLSSIKSIFNFLIVNGAVGDRHPQVQTLMRDTGLTIIDVHGKAYVKDLLLLFDTYLSQPSKATETHDRIREGVVVFSGTLAKHLDASDKMIPEIILKLTDTLKTPSEPVQQAVAECLPALLKVNKDQAPELIKGLLKQLFESTKYGERKGAAYGIAGIVKGCGVSSLRNFRIMSSLKEAVEDKKNATRREGALFAYETLSSTLGRLFEPFIIQILPLLLVCFGDANREVREATNDTCRTIMSKLSAYCVKLILPSILAGLDDRSWRTKTGSIEVLGSMAFLAPKQLSQSLPTVIPRLSEVLSDTHKNVQEAAKQALHQFGKVIKNPEIQALVPTFISALVDPTNKTLIALSAVLDTSFSHYIDAPSLALLVPILKRAFKERGIELKKKCGLIIGNLVSLTEHSELITYLPILMPGVHELLADPVPEVRAIAAKGLGIMVGKLGEPRFPDLVSQLMETLKGDAGAVDRSGAAQGLSEVIAGLGLERLEGLLPEIIEYASSTRLYVREGFMTLFIYLPVTHGESFTPYLDMIIPPILKGLADESDTVRNAGMKSGQVIVRNYSIAAIDLLLPKLQDGLFSESWRIRQSSLELLGDLLYKLAGLSVKSDSMESLEDQDSGTETGRKALIRALGMERFHNVLSCLYMARSDSNAVVRQSSMHVWKAIVVNTPKTLKEILPVLMQTVISNLATANVDKRGIAARTLGDLVRKLGDLVLFEIVPVLEASLESEDACTRQGVCIGMAEIMSSGKEQVSEFAFQYIPLVKKAIVDAEPEVRESAAKVFIVTI